MTIDIPNAVVIPVLAIGGAYVGGHHGGKKDAVGWIDFGLARTIYGFLGLLIGVAIGVVVFVL